ncbi:MAG TPA: hypothetical protein VGF30_03395 [Bacteroidia bacterium]
MFYTPQNIIKEISTSTVVMRLLDTGIIHYSYFPNVDVDAEHHIENHNALVELAGETKYPILVDAAEIVNITNKGREKIKELELAGPTLVRAFVTRSIGHKLLIGFYMRVNKSNIENKMFSNYEEAVEWLMEKKNKELVLEN